MAEEAAYERETPGISLIFFPGQVKLILPVPYESDEDTLRACSESGGVHKDAGKIRSDKNNG
jgi:hypothetical protein